MATIQGFVGVVPNTCCRRQQEWVGEVDTTIVITDYPFPFSIDGLVRTMLEDAIHLRVENVLTDEPTTIEGKTGEMGMLP